MLKVSFRGGCGRSRTVKTVKSRVAEKIRNVEQGRLEVENGAEPAEK